MGLAGHPAEVLVVFSTTGAGSVGPRAYGADVDVDAMLQLATRLAREAGDLAVARITTATAFSKGDAGDLVTEADRESEALIVRGIRERFPEHAVLGEETGLHGAVASEVRWLVDPLDGTNNYVMGVPYFGVCITACVEDEPIVSVAHNSPARRTFAAARDAGCTVDGVPIRIPAPRPLRHATVAWTQGYGVDIDDPQRNRAFARLERATKRVTRSWAPSIDWGLLAQGHLTGLVAYQNEPWDLVGGVLIAKEAGATVARDASGRWVAVAHPDALPQILEAIELIPKR